MKVYRYLREKELNNILNGKVDEIGNTYSNKNSNNFNYAPNKKYLHFFKNVADLNHIRKIKIGNINEGVYKYSTFYYCAFEIPKLVLFFAAGKGFYTSSGYDVDHVSAREYAILVDNFNPQWLQSYVKDNLKQPFNEEELTKKLNSGYKEETTVTEIKDVLKRPPNKGKPKN